VVGRVQAQHARGNGRVGVALKAISSTGVLHRPGGFAAFGRRLGLIRSTQRSRSSASNSPRRLQSHRIPSRKKIDDAGLGTTWMRLRLRKPFKLGAVRYLHNLHFRLRTLLSVRHTDSPCQLEQVRIVTWSQRNTLTTGAAGGEAVLLSGSPPASRRLFRLRGCHFFGILRPTGPFAPRRTGTLRIGHDIFVLGIHT
jgi:hypothetical protein